jgi:hypothetical protein
MKSGFHVLAGRLLLALARGWLWLGERTRAPGDGQFAYQFFLGLLGLSISMADIDFVTAFGDRPRAKNRALESPPSDLIGHTGYGAQRAPRTRHAASAKARPRDPDSRPRRRPTFRAENPQRIRRLR